MRVSDIQLIYNFLNWTTKLTAVCSAATNRVVCSPAAAAISGPREREREVLDLAKGVFGVKAGHRLLIMLSYLHTLIIASRLRVKPPRAVTAGHRRVLLRFYILTDAALTAALFRVFSSAHAYICRYVFCNQRRFCCRLTEM